MTGARRRTRPRGASRVACVLLLTAAVTGGCASAGPALAKAGATPTRPPAATPATTMALTVESWDPRLASALAALSLGPTADGEYQVALQYRRLGILDTAYSHLAKAVELDPDDAGAYDFMARIWRDWGFPAHGLPLARRAVELAPRSAPAANTLGTLLEGTGHLVEARLWYERAIALDGNASYARNNLCYATIMQGSPSALADCRLAHAAAPDSAVARNNLALAYAAGGDLTRARETFEQADDPASMNYNMGILYLSARQYEQAAAAFAAALRVKPGFALALRRQKEALALWDGHHKAKEVDGGHD
jgi:Tfp pilus assembly protein PilF